MESYLYTIWVATSSGTGIVTSTIGVSYNKLKDWDSYLYHRSYNKLKGWDSSYLYHRSYNKLRDWDSYLYYRSYNSVSSGTGIVSSTIGVIISSTSTIGVTISSETGIVTSTFGVPPKLSCGEDPGCCDGIIAHDSIVRVVRVAYKPNNH